jgi:hypothetical protein
MKARDWRISFNHFVQNKLVDNGGGVKGREIVQIAGRGTRGEGTFEAFTGTVFSMKLIPTISEAISLPLSTGGDVMGDITVHCIYISYSGTLIYWISRAMVTLMLYQEYC